MGVLIANDSRESIRANRVANRPCHQAPTVCQFEKATSRDPLSSWDPLPISPSQRASPGGRPEGGVAARREVGVPARGVLRLRGQEAGSPPNKPGPFAFSQEVPERLGVLQFALSGD